VLHDYVRIPVNILKRDTVSQISVSDLIIIFRGEEYDISFDKDYALMLSENTNALM